MFDFEFYGDPEKDLGRWRDLGKSEDKPLRARVRAIPPDVDSRIRRRYKELRNQRLHVEGKRKVSMELQVEAEREVAIERASYACLELDGLPLKPMDDDAVETFRKLLPPGTTVERGERTVYSGVPSAELKAHLFRYVPALRARVLDLVDEESGEAAFEEDELGKT